MKCTAIVYTELDKSASAGQLPGFLRPIAGKPLLAHTLQVFEDSPDIDEIILVIDSGYLLYASENIVDRYQISKVRRVRNAGKNRFATILSGLEGVSNDCEMVAVHDGLRPFITAQTINDLINECTTENAVVLGVTSDVPVKRAEQGYILASLDMHRIFLVQTPQVFKLNLLKDAYRQAKDSQHDFKDDAAVVEHYGCKVRVVEGNQENIRVDSEYNFMIAKHFLENKSSAGNDND